MTRTKVCNLLMMRDSASTVSARTMIASSSTALGHLDGVQIPLQVSDLHHGGHVSAIRLVRHVRVLCLGVKIRRRR